MYTNVQISRLTDTWPVWLVPLTSCYKDVPQLSLMARREGLTRWVYFIWRSIKECIFKGVFSAKDYFFLWLQIFYLSLLPLPSFFPTRGIKYYLNFSVHFILFIYYPSQIFTCFFFQEGKTFFNTFYFFPPTFRSEYTHLEDLSLFLKAKLFYN